jgi:DNA-binding transcriptional LysR family regulator
MGLTQSAMSNALAQLRTVTGDPLFVRAPGGVAPTERARALAGPVRQALALLDTALAPPAAFDPKTAVRTFAIATSDYVEFVLLGPLLKALERRAPGIRIELRAWSKHEVPEELRHGGLDLMIGFYGAIPAGCREERLFDEDYVCIVRKGHPRLRPNGRLTPKDYAAMSHILVSERGAGPGSVDKALAKLGLARTVGVRLTHFLMVPPLVASTDMVAALSRRVGEPFAKMLPLRVFPPPIPLPRATIGQVWHSSTDADPAQAWLRGVVRDVCARI